MTSAKGKVLVAEDENIIALDIKKTLEKSGYEVTSINSTAVNVIQKVETEKPDVILMDIMLRSSLDGIEAAKIIHYKYNIPIIYLTALRDNETFERAKSTDPFDYLQKPFDVDKLESAIERAIAQSRRDKIAKKIYQ
jgi:two-component system, response regulator PdtaR